MPCADSVLKKNMIYDQVFGGAKPPQSPTQTSPMVAWVYIIYLLNFRRHTGLDHVTY